MIKRTISGSEIVTLALLKEHLKLSGTTEDNILAVYIGAARSYCENYTNRALITQTVEYILDQFPENLKYIHLPFYGLSTASASVQYMLDDVWTTLSTDEYRLDASSVPCRILLKNTKEWPDIDDVNGAVKITYTVTVSTLEKQFSNAILLMAAEMFSNRENPLRTIGSSGDRYYASLAEKLLVMDKVTYYG